MGRIIVFYHSADFDGWSSGAIVLKKYPNAKAIPINYPILDNQYKLDRLLKIINADDTVFVVDFSFSAKSFKFIQKKAKKLIWIDHHITAIEECKKENFNTVGLLSTEYAACELTWLYVMEEFTSVSGYAEDYYKDLPIPYPIKLLGRYDLWKHDYSKDVVPFQMGMKSYVSMADDKKWEQILDENNSISKIIERGNHIIDYLENNDYKIARGYAFDADFEGYKVVALNMRSGGASIFKNVFDHKYHDFSVSFLLLPSKKWVIAMYSENNDKIDLSKIAEKYGGGGHKNAAAFTIDNVFDVLKNIEPQWKRKKCIHNR